MLTLTQLTGTTAKQNTHFTTLYVGTSIHPFNSLCQSTVVLQLSLFVKCNPLPYVMHT